MFSALRIFRVLRVFKVISGERQMRVILDAIFRAIPGIAWAAGVMALIYARMGSAPAPGARGQVENMRTEGVRDFCKIFPVLLFSCRPGPHDPSQRALPARWAVTRSSTAAMRSFVRFPPDVMASG